jgi:hypothetical protein
MANNGVRAEWHLAELSVDEDPFEMISYSGTPINLNAPVDELAQTMVKLLMREGRIASTGLTCDLKDGGQDCLTCPMAQLDNDVPLSRLCRLGKDERAVEKRCKELDAQRAAGPSAVEEIAEDYGIYIELGGDAESSELLVAAGL